jgi:hypothetical protein
MAKILSPIIIVQNFQTIWRLSNYEEHFFMELFSQLVNIVVTQIGLLL